MENKLKIMRTKTELRQILSNVQYQISFCKDLLKAQKSCIVSDLLNEYTRRRKYALAILREKRIAEASTAMEIEKLIYVFEKLAAQITAYSLLVCDINGYYVRLQRRRQHTLNEVLSLLSSSYVEDFFNEDILPYTGKIIPWLIKDGYLKKNGNDKYLFCRKK